MKILIATDWYKPVINGVVTSVVNLETELRRKGHEVRILTLSPTIRSQEEENVYYMHSVSINRIYPYARIVYPAAKRHIKEIYDWHPDVIHTQCEFSSFLIAKQIARRLDVPIVHTYHTVYEDYTHYFAPTAGMGKSIAAVVSRRSCNRAARVIVPTEKVKKLLESYDVIRPIDVIPSGIVLDHFLKEYDQEKIDQKKKELGIPEGNRVIVSLGRLAKEKNESELLRYFQRFAPGNCTYLIVGDGPYRQELEKQAKEMGLVGKVIFCGMVQPAEVPVYYRLSDLFICASQSETQGITYIEAMASGVPVLCRKDDCLLSLIQNGINGCFYEKFEEFAQLAQKVLNDRDYAVYLTKNAKEKVQEYSTQTFAEKVLHTYGAVLGER